MKAFLHTIAEDLIQRFGKDLRKVTVVFPGKRAQMFLNKYLVEVAQGPVWAPRYATIDTLFRQMSELTPAEPIRTISLLYEIYSRHVPSPMSIDDFWGWGEILLTDFEDIDKHLVNAEAIFTNIQDLQALESGTDILDEEQLAALKDFFRDFSLEKNSEVRQRFLDMWTAMPHIYRELRQTLMADRLLYPGGIYRMVAEQLTSPEGMDALAERYHGQHFAFVGFNVLDDVEETLFMAMNKSGLGLFYWDYDDWYMDNPNNEAGLFIRRNLQQLHLPDHTPATSHRGILDTEHIKIIATSTDNAMVRQLPEWTSSHVEEDRESESAIVLCDEQLMRAAMHAIPTDANITMGFPLSDTPVHGLLQYLVDLHIDGWDDMKLCFRQSFLNKLQGHQLFEFCPSCHELTTVINTNEEMLAWLTRCMEEIGRHYALDENQEDVYIQLFTESTYQIYKTLQQFQTMIAEGILKVNIRTMRRLLRQQLASLSIPFHGEMSNRLQVMGVLETRNLDFRHLILLSVGEGILPRKSSEVSLIPYCLRRYFNLSTLERQNSVFAYYFYRLLQRAEDVTLMYNENSAGTTQREQSRFIRQLLAETDLPIEAERLAPSIQLPQTNVVEAVEKTPEVMARLDELFDLEHGDGEGKHRLSPTAFATYMQCPLKFYYAYVCNIRDEEDEDDEVDNRILGNYFHDAAELLYQDIINKSGTDVVDGEKIEALMQGNGLALYPYIDKAMKTEGQVTGINIIVRDVVHRYLFKLISDDYELAPLRMLGTEENCNMEMQMDTPSGKKTVCIGGRIDRIDMVNRNGQKTIRVVDYKTGSAKTGAKTMDEVLTSDKSYVFQAFFYSIILAQTYKEPIVPALYYVRQAIQTDGSYDPCLRLGKDEIYDIREYEKNFLEKLETTIQDIFNPDISFYRCDDEKKCSNCPLVELCCMG